MTETRTLRELVQHWRDNRKALDSNDWAVGYSTALRDCADQLNAALAAATPPPCPECNTTGGHYGNCSLSDLYVPEAPRTLRELADDFLDKWYTFYAALPDGEYPTLGDMRQGAKELQAALAAATPASTPQYPIYKCPRCGLEQYLIGYAEQRDRQGQEMDSTEIELRNQQTRAEAEWTEGDRQGQE